jgi:fructose-specific component phosphotransferase system IIB-like protein
MAIQEARDPSENSSLVEQANESWAKLQENATSDNPAVKAAADSAILSNMNQAMLTMAQGESARNDATMTSLNSMMKSTENAVAEMNKLQVQSTLEAIKRQAAASNSPLERLV